MKINGGNKKIANILHHLRCYREWCTWLLNQNFDLVTEDLCTRKIKYQKNQDTERAMNLDKDLKITLL